MKPKFQDTQKITVKVKANPKTKGTDSYKRFSKYRSGMTVAAALKAGVLRGDLIWDTKHGFVSIR